jgi:beta-galactosidase
MKFKNLLPIFLICFLLTFNIQAQKNQRTIVDLSNNNWKLWLDTNAKWVNDKLFANAVDVKELPVNLPTGGWEALKKAEGKTVHLPATVEQYFWGKNKNLYGVSGNYVGVSWFTTTFNVPKNQKSKRISLHFEAIRFRAEIFINKKLVAYDLINGTPFEVDITKHINAGLANKIAVRITDPNGNFDWRDQNNFMWGNYRTSSTHGFGGITGKVKLITTNQIYTSDIFIKNKPRPNEINVEVTTNNISNKEVESNLLLQIKEAKPNGKIVFKQNYPHIKTAIGSSTKSFNIIVKDAKLWSVDSPNLYTLTVTNTTADKIRDVYKQRFGFRWFEIRDVAGDKQFYLNDKRIVLITSISWGFWPQNGITPTDALARKQILQAKKLGLNMLNFHRAIGQPKLLDYADEMGLLYYEEPGGNHYPADKYNPTDVLGKMQTDFYFATRDEKLFRMIKRDRNHPSLIIYNLHNERGATPQKQDTLQMLAAHRLDETRLLTYNSSNNSVEGDIKLGHDPRFKLHLLPYDFTLRDYGWFDVHYAAGPGTYHDNLYKTPKDYSKYLDHNDEIIYYGEDGAIGTPPRLQLIRDEILKTGKSIGWGSNNYLKWYNAYDSFLKHDAGFNKVYHSVDTLTKAMGNVAFYYHGRTIENVQLSNTIDGYTINGLESVNIDNHSGILDEYRNLKGDPKLISRYNKSLYVAVKLNRKVLRVGDTTIADFFIINKLNINGKHTLRIKVKDKNGNLLLTKNVFVNITGGATYGELLSAGLPISATQAGYTTITAELQSAGKTIAKGDDKFYAVNLSTEGIPSEGMVADTSGVLVPFLKSVGVNGFKEFKFGRPQGKYLLVGAFQPQQTGTAFITDILEWVNEGNTLIVVNNIEAWSTHLSKKEVIDYRGSNILGPTWYGGNFFSKQHSLFNGLPQAQVFNWEYQCFATYNKKRLGLRLFNGETVVACVADHKKEIYSALSIVPHGRGKIILCSLDIFSCLKDIHPIQKLNGDGENGEMNSYNASQNNSANVVGQQLLLNMLKYAKFQKTEN